MMQEIDCPLHGSHHPMGKCKVLLEQAQKMKAQWNAQKANPDRYKYRRSDGDKDRKAKYAKREANEIAEEKNTDSRL